VYLLLIDLLLLGVAPKQKFVLAMDTGSRVFGYHDDIVQALLALVMSQMDDPIVVSDDNRNHKAGEWR